MTDICKCWGDGCPLKKECYRFLAPATSEYQLYIDSPYEKKSGDCQMFWEVDSKRRKQMLLDLQKRGAIHTMQLKTYVDSEKTQNDQEVAKE